MPNVYEADRRVRKARFAIVVARYNRSITEKLLDGALEALRAHGVAEDAIDVAWVPGAWELPLIAQQFAKSGRVQGIVCLGAVIRGETSHDQHINRQVSLSLGRIALESGIPVSFGVLTTHSFEQAASRAGGDDGNKGVECAEAALEMVQLLEMLGVPSSSNDRLERSPE